MGRLGWGLALAIVALLLGAPGTVAVVHSPDRVIVRWAPGASPAEGREARARRSASWRPTLPWCSPSATATRAPTPSPGFSSWGASSVDLGAPGTETLSTDTRNCLVEDDFEGGDFALRWSADGPDGGFVRTGASARSVLLGPL